jgi:hypothetical protein
VSVAGLVDLPDPRRWPVPGDAPPAVAALHRIVEERLALTATQAEEAADARIDDVLATWLESNERALLAAAFDRAPAADVYRHLWRRLAAAEPRATSSPTLAAVLFALPVVIVAAREPAADPAIVPGTLHDVNALADLLRAHGVVAGEARIALAPALASPESIDLAALPNLVGAARTMLAGAAAQPLPLAPAPVRVDGTAEAAHLRFVVGLALCAPGAMPLHADARGAGLPLTRALSAALATPGATVLALAGAAQRLVPALAAGRSSQRQVALELFTTNALRRLRASFGEPTAVLSAHAALDAPRGGELRLSLASPFGPRDAEGFRYPLQPHERVPDAAASIATLLQDCRVADVRVMPGVQPDRDPATGLLRFCRADDVERTVH